jgi:hypothetical protein
MIRRPGLFAVCRRGHVRDELAVDPKSQSLGYCPVCGSEIIWKCDNCGEPVQGVVQEFGFPSSIPPVRDLAGDFCPRCGLPLPWASRKSIYLHIENLLQSESSLSVGDRRALIEQMKVLGKEPRSNETERAQVTALKALRKTAPKVWEGAQPLLRYVVTSYIKSELKLPP